MKISDVLKHLGNLALIFGNTLGAAVGDNPANFTWNLAGKALFSSLAVLLYSKGK